MAFRQLGFFSPRGAGRSYCGGSRPRFALTKSSTGGPAGGTSFFGRAGPEFAGRVPPFSDQLAMAFERHRARGRERWGWTEIRATGLGAGGRTTKVGVVGTETKWCVVRRRRAPTARSSQGLLCGVARQASRPCQPPDPDPRPGAAREALYPVAPREPWLFCTIVRGLPRIRIQVAFGKAVAMATSPSPVPPFFPAPFASRAEASPPVDGST